MNKRRYDEVIALVASVLFGIAVQDFWDITENVGKLGLNGIRAHFVALAVFIAYFRNIHGLIAYDAFIENTEYRAPYEEKTRHIVIYFVFGCLAALLLPYLVVYVTHYYHDKEPWISHPWCFGLFFIGPVLIYLPWNAFWLSKLLENELTVLSAPSPLDSYPRPFNQALNNTLNRLRELRDGRVSWRTAHWVLIFYFCILFLATRKAWRVPHISKTHHGQYSAYRKILEWTVVWCAIDAVMASLLVLSALLLFWFHYPRDPSVASIIFAFSCVSVISLALDYAKHAEFYFPLPKR